MRTIWHIPLEKGGDFPATVPIGAKPLCVLMRADGIPAVYFDVESDNDVETRMIYVRGTNEDIGDVRSSYLGSVQNPLTGVVGHVFT